MPRCCGGGKRAHCVPRGEQNKAESHNGDEGQDRKVAKAHRGEGLVLQTRTAGGRWARRRRCWCQSRARAASRARRRAGAFAPPSPAALTVGGRWAQETLRAHRRPLLRRRSTLCAPGRGLRCAAAREGSRPWAATAKVMWDTLRLGFTRTSPGGGQLEEVAQCVAVGDLDVRHEPPQPRLEGLAPLRLGVRQTEVPSADGLGRVFVCLFSCAVLQARTSSTSLLFSLTRLRGCFGGSSGSAFLSPSSFLSCQRPRGNGISTSAPRRGRHERLERHATLYSSSSPRRQASGALPRGAPGHGELGTPCTAAARCASSSPPAGSGSRPRR